MQSFKHCLPTKWDQIVLINQFQKTGKLFSEINDYVRLSHHYKNQA